MPRVFADRGTEEDLLSIGQAARALGTNGAVVKALLRNGTLHRVPEHPVRLRRAEVERMVKNRHPRSDEDALTTSVRHMSVARPDANRGRAFSSPAG